MFARMTNRTSARRPDSASRSEDPGDGNETHFGFSDVPVADKAGLVRGVFDSVATRYDLMNDLMSGGIHRLWKAAMVEWLRPRPGMHVLDVAGGTGDIAFRILDRGVRPLHVTVLDINESMVRVGRDRAIDTALLQGIDWVVGDAERLPLPDRSVDAYTIAFGIRNVTDIPGALREARRVLRPGGRFLCLEFSQVSVAPLAALYDRYSFSVLPRLGGAVAGDEQAYRYLAESIRRFPDQEAFAGLIEEAGLGEVRCRSLAGGIAALHSAWRI
jgi:demethylmenaquinone methyltransferase/2-methoxy-6-polyprenyl-1,4-benzoquinol methylase